MRCIMLRNFCFKYNNHELSCGFIKIKAQCSLMLLYFGKYYYAKPEMLRQRTANYSLLKLLSGHLLYAIFFNCLYKKNARAFTYVEIFR